MHLAVDLLYSVGGTVCSFRRMGPCVFGAMGSRRCGSGLPGIGMTTQLGMRRGFSGWNSGDQLEVYLVAMQRSWYSYMDTQSLCYFLMVRLQTYILINRIETCVSLW